MRLLLPLLFYILPVTLTTADAMFSTRAASTPSTCHCLPSTVSDTLPPTDSLFLSLQHYHDQQLQAQLAEFQISERGKWLKYIPSVGVGYSLGTDEAGNLKNVLRPSISYNSRVVYQVKQDRELRRAKMESIRRTAALHYANEKRTLELLLHRYTQLRTELAFRQQLHALDTELYEIATVQFAATEIPPSVYLPKKRTYLQQQFQLFQQQQNLDRLISEIYAAAKYF